MTSPQIERALEIRRTGADDAEDVHAMLLELARHDGGIEHVRVTTERWRDLLTRTDVMVFVAVCDGVPVGYVSAVRMPYLWGAGDLLALDDLYVREQPRNLGVGARLMSAIAAYAAEDELLIRWGAEMENVDANRFYRRIGASLRPKMQAIWTPAQYVGRG